MAKVSSTLLIMLAFFVPLSTSAVSALAILVALTWLVERDYKRKLREILDSRVCLAILFYLALYVLGLLWTSDLTEGFTMLKRHWKLLMVPFFLAAVSPANRQKVIYAFLAGLLVMVAATYLAWFDLLHYGGITPEHPTRKLYHVVYNPMLALGFYLVVHEIFWGGRSTGWRIALAVLAVAMAVNMFITEGRAGQVAFFVMVALLFLQLFKEKIIWGFVLASLLLPLLFIGGYKFSPNFHARVDKALHEIKIFNYHPQTSIGYRLYFWQVSWEMFKENPLIGVGTGDYNSVYAEKNLEQEKITHLKVMDTTNPHNQYVLVICQLGLIGMVAFFLIFGLQIFQALKGGDPLKRVQLAFPLLFLTIMMSESYFIVNETGFLFALFSAVLYKKIGEGSIAADGGNSTGQIGREKEMS